MLPSEAFFANFGSPVYLENGTMDFFSGLSGGGWGDSWPDSGGGWGDSWPDSGSLRIGFNIPVGGSGGSSMPDVKEILSAIANQNEDALKSNLAAFQQNQIGASQAIDNAWGILNRMTTSMLQYGTQGLISAAERDRRVDSRYLRWDYIAYYIDPISQKANGKPAEIRLLPSVSMPGIPGYSEAGFSMNSNWGWLIAGGLLLFLVWKKAKK
jgi:hypothetical protein